MKNATQTMLVVLALLFITSCAAKKELAGLKEECQAQYSHPGCSHGPDRFFFLFHDRDPVQTQSPHGHE